MNVKFTRRLVLNKRYGGFGISEEAWNLLLEKGYEPTEQELRCAEDTKGRGIQSYGDDVPRDNPILIDVVETLGRKANGRRAQLKVVNVTLEIDIEDYDGIEHAVVYGGENWI
jgi:hypothetical protein